MELGIDRSKGHGILPFYHAGTNRAYTRVPGKLLKPLNFIIAAMEFQGPGYVNDCRLKVQMNNASN